MPAVKPDQDESRFRAWLVQRVKHSRWTSRNCTDLAAVARRLGVQPDVLVDAQSALDAEQEAAGRTSSRIGQRYVQHRKPRVFTVDMPPVVFADMKAYCELRQVNPFVVLRSLVVKLLTGTAQPTWLGRGWLYKGQHYPSESHGVRHSVGTDVSEGAGEALTIRATVTGVSPSALLRGMVIDLLEGRVVRLTIVNTVAQMPDDVNQYVTLEETLRTAGS
jgi:hypothetical protein